MYVWSNDLLSCCFSSLQSLLFDMQQDYFQGKKCFDLLTSPGTENVKSGIFACILSKIFVFQFEMQQNHF